MDAIRRGSQRVSARHPTCALGPFRGRRGQTRPRHPRSAVTGPSARPAQTGSHLASRQPVSSCLEGRAAAARRDRSPPASRSTTASRSADPLARGDGSPRTSRDHARGGRVAFMVADKVPSPSVDSFDLGAGARGPTQARPETGRQAAVVRGHQQGLTRRRRYRSMPIARRARSRRRPARRAAGAAGSAGTSTTSGS